MKPDIRPDTGYKKGRISGSTLVIINAKIITVIHLRSAASWATSGRQNPAVTNHHPACPACPAENNSPPVCPLESCSGVYKVPTNLILFPHLIKKKLFTSPEFPSLSPFLH